MCAGRRPLAWNPASNVFWKRLGEFFCFRSCKNWPASRKRGSLPVGWRLLVEQVGWQISDSHSTPLAGRRISRTFVAQEACTGCIWNAYDRSVAKANKRSPFKIWALRRWQGQPGCETLACEIPQSEHTYQTEVRGDRPRTTWALSRRPRVPLGPHRISDHVECARAKPSSRAEVRSCGSHRRAWVWLWVETDLLPAPQSPAGDVVYRPKKVFFFFFWGGEYTKSPSPIQQCWKWAGQITSFSSFRTTVNICIFDERTLSQKRARLFYLTSISNSYYTTGERNSSASTAERVLSQQIFALNFNMMFQVNPGKTWAVAWVFFR